MIIDVNVFIGSYPFRNLLYSHPEKLIALMDQCAIRKALVGNFEGVFYRESHTANELLMEQILLHKNRLIPCATLNPAFPRAIEDLETCAQTGFAGIRLFPGYHNYALGAPAVNGFFDRARELEMPLFIYSKLVDQRFRHWLDHVLPLDIEQIVDLLNRVNGNTIVLCHAEIVDIETILSRIDLQETDCTSKPRDWTDGHRPCHRPWSRFF